MRNEHEKYLSTLYQLEDLERRQKLLDDPCNDETLAEENTRISIGKKIAARFCAASDEEVACEQPMPSEWKIIFQKNRYSSFLSPRRLAIVALTQPLGTLTDVTTLCAINSYLPFESRIGRVGDLPPPGQARSALLACILEKEESEWPEDLRKVVALTSIELIQKTQIDSSQAFEFYTYVSKLLDQKQLAAIALSQAKFIASTETTLKAIQAHTNELVTLKSLSCAETRERLLKQVQSSERFSPIDASKTLIRRIFASMNSENSPERQRC